MFVCALSRLARLAYLVQAIGLLAGRSLSTSFASYADYPDATPAGNHRNLAASWNPFSTGPRNCIGQALALAELRTVLAVLMSNFIFELPEGVQREKFIEEEEVWWVTLQAKHGLPLKVTPIIGDEKKKTGFVPKSTFYSEELLRIVREAEAEQLPSDQQ